VAPTGHRSVATTITLLDEYLTNHLPSQGRACYYYARGLLYHLQGDTGRAIADYSTAIGWMADYGDAYAARGDAHADSGQTENANRDYALAAPYSNDTAKELVERCWLRALRGRPLSLALQDCDAALRQKPKNPTALFILALAKLRSGDTAGGNADLAAAIDAGDRVKETFAIYGVKP
jgi:tetratricopeptide (TPR) repeat protein